MRGKVPLLLSLLATAACGEDGPLTPLAPDGPSTMTARTPPAALVSIAVGAAGLLSLVAVHRSRLLGRRAGSPQPGLHRPRRPPGMRSALFALSGDRSAAGLPNVAPFNCTWTDAIGDLQTAWNASSGWVGSAVQLACGASGPSGSTCACSRRGRPPSATRT